MANFFFTWTWDGDSASPFDPITVFHVFLALYGRIRSWQHPLKLAFAGVPVRRFPDDYLLLNDSASTQ